MIRAPEKWRSFAGEILTWLLFVVGISLLLGSLCGLWAVGVFLIVLGVIMTIAWHSQS